MDIVAEVQKSLPKTPIEDDGARLPEARGFPMRDTGTPKRTRPARVPLPLGERHSIYEIAAQAGVSIATVSRVLNNRPSVAPETREDVLECIRKMSYVPRRGTRRMPSLSVLLEFGGPLLTPYIAEVVGGISAFTDETGLSLSIFSLTQPKVRERGLIPYLRENDIHGTIILLSNDNSRYIADLEADLIPFIVFNNRMGGRVPFIDVDNALGTEMALRHLHQLGHRSIAFIGGNLDNDSLRSRYTAYRSSVVKYGLDTNPQLARVEPMDHPCNHLMEGYEKTKRLLDSGVAFTAVNCVSDELAFGAVRALLDAGRSVPADVSVIGFDDCEMSMYVNPALTTVKQPLRAMGYRAARELSRLVDDYRAGIATKRSDPQGIVERPELILRESTGPRK